MTILDSARSQIVSKYFFEAKNQQKSAIFGSQNRQIAPEKKKGKKGRLGNQDKKGNKLQNV